MTVYLIDSDVNNYRSLQLDDSEEAEDAFEFDCTPKGKSWRPPKMYCEDPTLPIADFWDIAFAAALTVGSKAVEKVRTQFEMAGELLPLKFETQRLTLLNVRVCSNCLDHDRCKWITTKSGRRLYPDPDVPSAFVFNKRRFEESTIFKIPELRTSHVFCVEREKDPETEFKAAVEYHRLTGLRFKQLWSE